MAEQRKKSDSILLHTEGNVISMELFPFGEWPEGSDGDGLFRLRIAGVWYCPTGKYSLLTRFAIGELVATLTNGGEFPQEEPVPYLPHKADVLVRLDD